MKTLISIALLVATFGVQADCPVERPGKQPVVPDGEVATTPEIQQAQREAESYRLQVETYMGCGVMNRRQHYMLLTQLEMFLENYNRELTEYQGRETLVAEK